MTTDSIANVLTPDEISTSYKISKRTLENWRRKGSGPPWIRLGRQVRYPRSGFEAWINAQRETGARA
jgi:predicted DNA-binding transcriptional regulator AlpA